MLTRDTLERSYQLTEQLDAAKFYLRPVAGTVLGALVTATRSNNNFMIGSGGAGVSFEPSIADIEYMANQPNPATGCSDHDAAQDSAALMGIDAVTNQINSIRTQVGPAVAQMAEKTMAEVNGLSTSKLLGLEVVIQHPAAPLMYDSLEKDVRRTEGVPYDNPVLGLSLAPMAVSDIIKNMETGTASLDDCVRQWAASKGDTFFLTIWETFFMVNPELHAATNKVLTLRDFMDASDDAPEVSLTIYLLARKLWDNPPENTAMNLETYERLMLSFRNQAANSVARHIDILQGRLKAEILVLKTEGPVTTVFGPVYKDWIEKEGSSNEILFGNAVSEHAYTTREDIDTARATLMDAWNRYDMLTRETEAIKRHTRIKETLRSVFKAQVYEDTEGQEHAEELRQKLTTMFEAELIKVTEEDTKDIYALSLKLLCRSRFIASDAELFLTDFNNLKKENPQVSDDEVATICSMKYVVRWLVEQTEVIKAP